MKNEQLKQLFRQADTELSNAQRDLYQPSHDVITYSVCVNARSALYRFMQCLYLLCNDTGQKIDDESYTLLELIDACRNCEEKLDTIDFSSMNCINRDVRQEQGDDFYFCDDTCMVQECTDYAAMVRELVLKRGRDILTTDP
ncbi:MAG: hypothetical protein ACNA8K_04120 [Cyclonatronaceae bacterium]